MSAQQLVEAMWQAADPARSYLTQDRARIAAACPTGMEADQLERVLACAVIRQDEVFEQPGEPPMSLRLIDAVAALEPADTEFAETAAVRRVAAGEVGFTRAVANLALAVQTHAITICTAVTRLEAHGRLRAWSWSTPETTRTGETWSDFSQLTSLTTGSMAFTGQYASTDQSERIRLGDTYFHNGPLGLAGTSTGGVDTGFNREPQGTLNSMTSGASSLYYLTDALGSVIALVDDTGTKVNSYTYTPRGTDRTATEKTPQPYRFAAGYKDPTDLYHLGARYFREPGCWTLGRWNLRGGNGPGVRFSFDGWMLCGR